MVTTEQVRVLVKKYQKLLHLQDWIITSEVIDELFLQLLIGNRGVLGAVLVYPETRTADIYIWDQADTNIEGITLEYVVVHEMIHILLKPLDDILNNICKRIDNKAVVYWIQQFSQKEVEILDNLLVRIILEAYKIPVRIPDEIRCQLINKKIMGVKDEKEKKEMRNHY